MCTSDVTQTEVIVRSVPCNIEVSAKVRVTTTFSDGIRFIRTSAASNILYTGGTFVLHLIMCYIIAYIVAFTECQELAAMCYLLYVLDNV